MSIVYDHWPDELAEKYRAKGYWIDKPLTDILLRQCDNDNVALIDRDTHYSYRQLNDISDHLACALRCRGLNSGDTALVQLGNVAEFIIVFFALLKCGIAPVNAVLSHQRTEMEAYALQIQPKLLIADRQHTLFHNDDFIERLKEISPVMQVIALRNDQGKFSLNLLMRESVENTKNVPSPADEVAFFQLSGGSTGTPKLIPRTHNDYYYSIRRSTEICTFDKNTRFLCAIPIVHNYIMSSPGWLGVFYSAGCVVLADNPDATVCFPLIEKYKINVAALIPPAVSLWLQALSLWKNDNALTSLQLLQVGGAHLSETLARRIPQEIGCQLQQVFGMAEGLVNYTRPDDDPERIFTTQGRPMCPDDEVWVADQAGNPLPTGCAGLLMTRGPYTFRGYYRSPEHNATCFDKNGFYCSGDIIVIDDNGYIKVVGREKDQINRGGEKIASEEIENLLMRHESIINVALVSMEDPILGEKSCAFITSLSPIRAVEVRRYLRTLGVADYKLPDRVENVDELPLTPVGKVDKKQLRNWIARHQLAVK